MRTEIIVTKESNGWDISAFIAGQKTHSAWANDETTAMRKASSIANYYTDENGQSLSVIVRK